MTNARNSPLVSVVIPARNEDENIGTCLKSLLRQEGIAFEIYVVDDHSTDRTREIAQSYAGVIVLPAHELQPGWRGKANAIWTAVPYLKGEWLLFTDADTTHLPGSLAASVQEALECKTDLLSYSPFQEAGTLGEKCVQPVVFGELNQVFNYAEVNDAAKAVAAANGQFMLFRREAYLRIGGHETVKGSLLEDVDLAQLIKKNGRLRFRHAPDCIHTRMYRTFSQLEEGWTKNLSLLFPNAASLAFRRICEFVAILGGTLGCALSLILAHAWMGILLLATAMVAFSNLMIRIRRAGFPVLAGVLGIGGLPIFVYLLARSYRAFHVSHEINWRGRTYKNV
ncbi:MAG: glycosyltransferase family 2 protein [Acidobacteriia bacterium]|nr:glycosyltransferase family 2 protein [Terriglobia bacterium]